MGEDGEQDAVHGCFVLEGSHGSGPSSYFAESSFDSVGGSYFAALILRFVAETGQQFVEVVSQASDSCRIAFLKTVGEAAGGGARGRWIGGIHDLVERTLNLRLIGFADLVEHVSDLVSPAALERNAVQ